MAGGGAYSSFPGVKILWINPLGVSGFDQPMAEVFKQIKEPNTTVEVVSLALSAPLDNVEFRTFETFVIRETVELTRYGAVNGYDGVVIGCFYDPALLDAREISGEAVVVAPCEASLQIVTRLASRRRSPIGCCSDPRRRDLEDQASGGSIKT
jgi:allantoin racemase